MSDVDDPSKAGRVGVGGGVGVRSLLQSDGCGSKGDVNMGGADRNMRALKSGFRRTFAWFQSQPLP
jgi:hypothetical protein